MKILREHLGPVHTILLPVGGGGLVAGIAGLCELPQARENYTSKERSFDNVLTSDFFVQVAQLT
jgi:hypothetical protein